VTKTKLPLCRVAGASFGRQRRISAWDYPRDWAELQGSWERQQNDSLKSVPCTKFRASEWSEYMAWRCH